MSCYFLFFVIHLHYTCEAEKNRALLGPLLIAAQCYLHYYLKTFSSFLSSFLFLQSVKPHVRTR